jgi:hypothetical protein
MDNACGALYRAMKQSTPAFAQLAANPGDQHTQTLYMQQYAECR